MLESILNYIAEQWVSLLALLVAICSLIIARNASRQSSKDAKAIKEATINNKESELKVMKSKLEADISCKQQDLSSLIAEQNSLSSSLEHLQHYLLQEPMKSEYERTLQRSFNIKDTIRQTKNDIYILTEQVKSINQELHNL